MNLHDFSFDSAMDSKAIVSIQTPLLSSKDVRLPWKLDLEHLLGNKTSFTLILQVFSGGELLQPLVNFSSD